MATPQSSLIIKRWEGFGGNFVDADYLGHSYEASKPYVFENTLMKLYSSKSRFFTGGKLLQQMLGSTSAGMKEIDTDIFRWKLQGAEHKSARVVEVVETSTAPGLGLTTFRIKLDLNYFARPDVLMGEDNEYPLEIVNGPIPDGTGYVYEVRIQGDSPSVFLPVSEIQLGRRFDKVWTSVSSEHNEEYGTQQAPASLMLENQLGYFAQKLSVTDKALRTDGRLGLDFIMTDGAGKQTKISKFIPYYEARMQEELYNSVEAQLVYGKKQTRPGSQGYVLRTGMGLREQLKDSWTSYYSGALTVNLLRDYLMDIFFTRENESNRVVRMMTGTLGSLLFHQALSNLANGFLTVDTHHIKSIGTTPSGANALQFGSQYTRYAGPEGIAVELYKNPMYDSDMYCKKYHPLFPNMPVDSARYTILGFGSSEGEANIQMVKEKNSFTHGYVPGMVSPMGPVTGRGMTASLKHSYDVGIQTSAGLLIRDVSQCGEIIYELA